MLSRKIAQDPTLPQGFSITFRQRFWKKIGQHGPIPSHKPELGPCYTWSGYINKSGYGIIGRGGGASGNVLAHVAMWIIKFGPFREGAYVCHKCDNKSCCNPNHLFIGDEIINAFDREAKGRGNHSSEENHRSAKLTRSKVRMIRRIYRKHDVTRISLAKMFGVSSNSIKAVILGISWKSDLIRFGNRSVWSFPRKSYRL